MEDIMQFLPTHLGAAITGMILGLLFQLLAPRKKTKSLTSNAKFVGIIADLEEYGEMLQDQFSRELPTRITRNTTAAEITEWMDNHKVDLNELKFVITAAKGYAANRGIGETKEIS